MRTNSPERERRHQDRSAAGEPSRPHIELMIVGTFGEMPGLRLHLEQAARLYGLQRRTCKVVLDDLVRAGRLRRSRDGQYCLPYQT
jgi:hypothetical protein